jgi:hypothetical protein
MRRLRFLGVSLAIVSAAALLTSVTATADSPPLTRGDAEALFNARNTGGFAVLGHGGVVEGAPADNSQRIGPGGMFEGFHVCATDWHVLDINLFTTDATDGVHTIGEARDLYATFQVTYELDGAPLPIMVTAVKPWLGDPTTLDPNATVAFVQTSGAILAPDALSVGPHTERVRFYVGGTLFDDLGDVTFFVDAAGTGACL